MAKNHLSLTHDCLYIECANTLPSTMVTASLADLDTIQAHRWRWIDNRCVTTTTDTDGLEKRIEMSNVLSGVERSEQVTHTTINPKDYRRETLSIPAINQNPTKFTTNGAITYLHLEDGCSVMIDTDQLDRVKGYRWSLVGKPRRFGAQVSVRASFKKQGKTVTVTLPRLLLDMDSLKGRYRHVDGNRLDCRLANLEIQKPGSKDPFRQSITVNVLSDSLTETRKTYTGLRSPTGEIHAPICGLRAFCDHHGLSYSATVRLITGRAQSHRGWTVYSPVITDSYEHE